MFKKNTLFVINMFSMANELARQYTEPTITFAKTIDDKVLCSSGAFVLLNENGWIITVAHLWDYFAKFVDDESSIKKYYEEIDHIQKNNSLSKADKKKKLSKIKKDSTWLTNVSFWWGADYRKLVDTVIFAEADLAIGRLEPFDPDPNKYYPFIKNPENIKPGTSLCKLGFPFHEATATYDGDTNCFNIGENVLPMPFFPMEGIYTRDLFAGKSKDGKYDINFLETSSPGLRGQSGGPIFDSNGVLWAIQCRTNNLDLGFSPTIIRNGKSIVENQFLNVGIGIHPRVIVQFLNENNVNFKLAD